MNGCLWLILTIIAFINLAGPLQLLYIVPDFVTSLYTLPTCGCVVTVFNPLDITHSQAVQCLLCLNLLALTPHPGCC
jgi:hypothetical protein